MKARIAPSILSADFANLEKETQSLQNIGVRWLHLDVMDGHFAPNITFGAPIIRALRNCCNLFFDAHLMIEEPERYIEALAAVGADLLAPHIEAMRHGSGILEKIRYWGLKTGVALNPGTDLNSIRWLLPWIDMVVIMGVNPGFSGQRFIPETVEKTGACREFLIKHGYGNIAIEIDGGVNYNNAGALLKAGADILVSGSAFFRVGDYKEALRQFRSIIKEQAREQPEREKSFLEWQHIGNLMNNLEYEPRI